MSEFITKIRTDQGDKQIDYNALANLPTISNPNLLINSDFRNPVNQRGKTSYVYTDNNIQYTVDRWRSTGCNVSVGGSSITIKNRSKTATAMVCQPFENSLTAGDYCVTIGCQNVVGNVYVALDANGSDKRLISDGVNTFKLHTTSKVDGLYILFGATSEDEGMTLYYAKLEQGTASTPFVPRLYAEELALCKRYFQSYHDEDDTCIILTQNYTTTTATNGRFNLPVEMRVKPTVSIDSMEVKDINNGDPVTITSIEGQSISRNMIEASARHDSIAVSPRYVYARFTADAEIY